MLSFDSLIEKAHNLIPNINEERVRKAFFVASEVHKGQKRESGEDYIYHPLTIANSLLDFLPDEDALIAALLHDTTEDGKLTIEDLKNDFGETVAELVNGLEKLSHVSAHGKDRQIGSLRKMFLAMAKDIRVVLIKLADRLHNMQSLHFLRKDKQERIAEETLTIYAPIAARLGVYALKGPLEDLSFFYLYPEDYADIAQQMKKHEPYRTRILKNAKRDVLKILAEDGVKGEITGRIKHYYSIFKKLQKKETGDIDNLYDIFALRIIVPTIKDCYVVLGRIHQHWTPLAKRFKDYIAVPKPNNYRSLHTTVIGLSGVKTRSVPIEIQIRTPEMQEEAEYGIAAHWNYKEKRGSEEASVWVRHLADIENKIKSNQEFVKNLQLDTFSDRIYVLTPNGDVKDLPFGATPIDFAFSVHTDVGMHIKAAKVNGKIVPLDYQLENGNVVAIITTKDSNPHQNWISFVKTTTARNKIRQYLKSQDKEKIIREGKDLINKQLKRFGLEELDPHLQALKEINGKKKTMREREEILERVGNGSLNAVKVVKGLLKTEEDKQAPKKQTYKTEIESESGKTSEILISGEEKIPVKMPQCCEPKEGDKIIGFITRGGHVTIHKKNCNTLKNLDPNRLVEARWASDKSSSVNFIVKLKSDRVGILRDVVDIFVKHNVNLEGFGYLDNSSPLSPTLYFKAMISNFELVSHLMDRIEQIDGVAEVKKGD